MRGGPATPEFIEHKEEPDIMMKGLHLVTQRRRR